MSDSKVQAFTFGDAEPVMNGRAWLDGQATLQANKIRSVNTDASLGQRRRNFRAAEFSCLVAD